MFFVCIFLQMCFNDALNVLLIQTGLSNWWKICARFKSKWMGFHDVFSSLRWNLWPWEAEPPFMGFGRIRPPGNFFKFELYHLLAANRLGEMMMIVIILFLLSASSPLSFYHHYKLDASIQEIVNIRGLGWSGSFWPSQGTLGFLPMPHCGCVFIIFVLLLGLMKSSP